MPSSYLKKITHASTLRLEWHISQFLCCDPFIIIECTVSMKLKSEFIQTVYPGQKSWDTLCFCQHIVFESTSPPHPQHNVDVDLSKVDVQGIWQDAVVRISTAPQVIPDRKWSSDRKWSPDRK